jgi:NAD(P)-dependent dehydrogenase (short-subunit alcohol dehydrogenase family)
VAGISARPLGDGPLDQCATEAWDTVMNGKAKGTFLMCREVLRVWTRNAQAGAILNMGSVVTQHPQREHFANAECHLSVFFIRDGNVNVLHQFGHDFRGGFPHRHKFLR